MSLIDIIPNLVVGLVFTVFALLKFYGLWKCMEGGRGKPLFQYVCGTCPSWKSHRSLRWWRWGAPTLFLGIGLWNLGHMAWLLWQHGHK